MFDPFLCGDDFRLFAATRFYISDNPKRNDPKIYLENPSTDSVSFLFFRTIQNIYIFLAFTLFVCLFACGFLAVERLINK